MGVERALDLQQEDSGLNGLDLRPRALFSKKSTGKDPFCWLVYLHVLIFSLSEMDTFVKYNKYIKMKNFRTKIQYIK